MVSDLNLQDTIQLVSGAIIVLATLAAGAWTIYKFLYLRGAKKALNMTISASVHPYGRGRLVDVKVVLTNTGAVPIRVSAEQTGKCLLEVCRVSEQGRPTYHGWNHPGLELIMPPIEYLADYRSWEDDKDPIILEPSVPCEVPGLALLQLQQEQVLLLRATFVDASGFLWRTQRLIDLR